MSKQVKHTEIPYSRGSSTFSDEYIIYGAEGDEVAQVKRCNKADANARFIVKCCNNHDRLVGMVKRLAEFAYAYSGNEAKVNSSDYAKFKEYYTEAFNLLSELEKDTDSGQGGEE